MEEPGSSGGVLPSRVRFPALAWAAAIVILAAGCGGGEAEKPKLDKPALEAAVHKIEEECIKAGGDPKSADPGISPEVGEVIEAYEADPKASLSDTDLKALTVEEVVGDTAETLDDCRPEDALRVREALAKP